SLLAGLARTTTPFRLQQRSAGRTRPVVEALLFRIFEIYQRYLAVVALGGDCHHMLFVPGAGLEREASLDGIVVFAIDRVGLVAAGFFRFRSARAAIVDLAILAQRLAIERRNLRRRISRLQLQHHQFEATGVSPHAKLHGGTLIRRFFEPLRSWIQRQADVLPGPILAPGKTRPLPS